MRSLSGDFPFIQYDDFIGIDNRGKPVRNHNNGLIFYEVIDRLLDNGFVFRVGVGGCLVEYHYGAVFQ